MRVKGVITKYSPLTYTGIVSDGHIPPECIIGMYYENTGLPFNGHGYLGKNCIYKKVNAAELRDFHNFYFSPSFRSFPRKMEDYVKFQEEARRMKRMRIITNWGMAEKQRKMATEVVVIAVPC